MHAPQQAIIGETGDSLTLDNAKRLKVEAKRNRNAVGSQRSNEVLWTLGDSV
jgi:hypothetical protein